MTKPKNKSPKVSKPKEIEKLNDQTEALYLLKTGTVLSVTGNKFTCEFNDSVKMTATFPMGLDIVPGSKARLYRYYLEDDEETDTCLIIVDPFIFHSFVYDSSGSLIRHGLGRTSEENFFNPMR